MSDIAAAWLGYGLAWVAFGALHSVTASSWLKSRLISALGAAYRLTYNGFAVFSIGLTVWAGLALFAGIADFDLTRTQKLGLGAMQIVGWIVLVLALRTYDIGLLLGTAQLQKGDGSIDGDEALHTDGVHRYVRHPIYSAAFLILWGIASTPFGLATAVYGSAYLVIGTWFEERKLLATYGEAYAAYRTKVPAFVPWRGRAWR